jgi:SRSO17 transposase
MPKLSEFEQYMTYLCEALGHADRHAGFVDYSRGLMLPIERKSVEPLAAHTDPWHVSAKHQSCTTSWRTRNGPTKRYWRGCVTAWRRILS